MAGFLTLFLIFINQASNAASDIKGGTWNVNNSKTNPVAGNPNAPKGGKIIWGALAYPRSLNFLISGV